MTKKFYITTAIDYVNGRPHIGHAFEKTIADALARWHRLKSEKVWFLTGTDENASKNAKAAKEAGEDTQKFVDKNSAVFIELCEKLNFVYDRFIRTTDKDHKEKARDIFQKVFDNGEIYKGKYEGSYCTGCERFIMERELVKGVCPEHGLTPDWISEDAYFFKLSKYKNKIIKFVEGYIVPDSRKKEILTRLKGDELRDLCVSRTNLDWGIDSPIDKNYKIYVWFDALINYLTGAGKNEEYWPADVHVVGKDINWFHSVIWPGILFSTKRKIPGKLLVHGFLNLKGEKMSKSTGNVLDPLELVEKYGGDSVRYSLLRCSIFEDSDYGEEILITRHNNELANKLGNLVSRVGGLAEKNGVEKTENKLLKKLKLKQIEKLIDNFELDKALSEIFAFIDICNEYVQNKKPWETKDKKVLYELVDSIKVIAILLWPFIPETSEKIGSQFGFEIDYKEIKKPLRVQDFKKGDILFTKILD